jgi:hypothetical protein
MSAKIEQQESSSTTSSLKEDEIDVLTNKALKWKERSQHFENKYEDSKKIIKKLKKQVQKLETMIMIKDERIKELKR